MPEDRRPPKRWWDNCISACHRHEIADDCNAFCGWLWYHGEEEGFGDVRRAFFRKCCLDDVCG
ncbi:MAG: hypothetical protein QXU26_04195 [Thermofilaceae archaeon]